MPGIGRRLKDALKGHLPDSWRARRRAILHDAELRRLKRDDTRAKRLNYRRASARHAHLLSKKQGVDRVRVAFIVLNASVWKVDPVLRRMLADPRYEPLIYLAPHLTRGERYMHDEMQRSAEYFGGRGLSVFSGLQGPTSDVVELPELDPDLVFFTNPHRVTSAACYEEPLERYLTCYVPYDHQVIRYGGDQANYNQDFHNMLWKIFAPHQYSRSVARRVQACRGANVAVTGYPACEPLWSPTGCGVDPWKPQGKTVRRIVWAPHHTISSPELQLSTFLHHADEMIGIAQATAGEVQWAFKPHPMLRPNLEAHVDWGPDRTRDYFKFWAESPNTQLNDGSYEELFIASDALIHDGGSFLAEYQYLNRPSMYLLREQDTVRYFNDFGMRAFSVSTSGRSTNEVAAFVESVVAGEDPLRAERERFLRSEIEIYMSPPPSQRILEHISAAFGLSAARQQSTR